ncbi:MAG: Fe-S cluster assembly sulfur transfer protein SufU [Acidimicrobiales bacterium]
MPGLEDLYREIILDHYRNPRNRGELASPPARRVEGFNPLCGDEIVVFLDIADDTVTDVKIGGQGCSISQSSASMMSAAVKGKSVTAAKDLIRTFKSLMSIHEARLEPAAPGDAQGNGVGPETDPGGESGTNVGPSGETEVDLKELGDLAALQGVVKFPVRIKCATLSWNTLAQGLDEEEAT